MQAFRQSALVLTLCAAACGAFAGEIANTNVNAQNFSNTSAGLGSSALQNIGVAQQNARIENSSVQVNGARNLSAGLGSSAT
jgi:hypothetical protein